MIPAEKGTSVILRREYISETGLACREYKSFQGESDFVNASFTRTSTDNGRTWSEWMETPQSELTTFYGADELTIFREGLELWNPVHKHFVSNYMTRLFLDGHEEAYRRYWEKGECAFFDHVRVTVRRSGEDEPCSDEPVFYEDGADFDGENPRDERFLHRNRAYGNPVTVLENGDIMIPVGIPVRKACEMAGIDVRKVFPSCPDIHHCVIAARGIFDPVAGEYRFTYSAPVILGDLKSSRGIDEPILAELKSGRILMIMRGSNTAYEGWGTRIEPGTPSFKWYAWSDDGGRTFTQPEPWHFDDREVIYSSASYSRFIRSSKNGNLYWIGNITDHTAYGNFPRFPLQIVQVDENTGCAMKETLTVIDTRREGESELVQLSNFGLYEDREIGAIVVNLAKIGQYDADIPFWGESWEYRIFPE